MAKNWLLPKRAAERKRRNRRTEEGFKPLSWVDPKTGKRVRLSQMGRKVTEQKSK